MNVAIIHYHLHPGGVTRVIDDHLRALNEAVALLNATTPVDVALLFSAGRTKSSVNLNGLKHLSVKAIDVPELAYDSGERPHSSLEGIQRALRQCGFDRSDTVLHFHNHSLGKNWSIPGAIRVLAEQGYGLLLQVHDFAEDFRPTNYSHLLSGLTAQKVAGPQWVYPQAPRIHYALLNCRDQKALCDAGADASRLHLLPNCATQFGPLPDPAEARRKLNRLFGIPHASRYFVYPVRGIRRKNLGECLLIAAALGNQVHIGVTMPAVQPQEKTSYLNWKRLSAQLDLTCHFETGLSSGLSLAENLAAADACLTTSVAEGFGLVFIESWLAGKALIGRDLPEITIDFAEFGLKLPDLYRRLNVPTRWLVDSNWYGKILSAFRATCADYQCALNQMEDGTPPVDLFSQAQHSLDQLANSEWVDFSCLPCDVQKLLVCRVANSREDQARLLEWNPILGNIASGDLANQELIAHNRQVVQQVYSLEVCGDRLLKIYQDILRSSFSPTIGALPRASRLIQHFVNIDRFHTLRVQ